MKLKALIFIITLLFPLLEINSEDIQQTNNNAFEFSIGGGITHQFEGYYITSLNSKPLYDLSFNTNKRNLQYWCLVPSQTIGITMPISFIYYFNNYYGLGFNTSIGIISAFGFSYVPASIDIPIKVKLINKIGKLNQQYFLSEIGVSVTGKISFEFIYPGTSLPGEGDQIMYFIGPSLFLGYEKKFKHTNFVIGINSDFDFNYISDYYFIDDIYKRKALLLNILVGIEMRISFSYLYIL
jgi:hypothetical protein